MKAYIVFGCEGREESELILCSGIKNILLDLEGIERTENYLDLIKYLDFIKIFDKSCFKTNVITNAICKIYEMGYMNDKKYEKLAYFYNMHRICGLSLCCIPKEGACEKKVE